MTYIVGSAGLGGDQYSGGPSSGTSTTLTYGGVTITGGGGGIGYGGAAGNGSGGDFNRTFIWK